MLPGVGRWPMPCCEANGLLPGRGPAGRWPMPCDEAKGLLPGRGAPGRGASPLGRSSAAGAGAAGAAGAGADGAGAAGAAASGAGAAGAGFAGPGRGPGLAVVAGALAAAGAAGAADSFAAGFAELSASIAARSLRATGGSMVEEGLLTNSPSSFSFASANLLSTPSSAAISCTRGLAATILLSEGGQPQTGQTISRGRDSFRAVHFGSIAVQPFLDGLRAQLR